MELSRMPFDGLSLRRQKVRSASRAVSTGRWSPRATLAFILVTCGGFWALAAFGVAHLLGY